MFCRVTRIRVARCSAGARTRPRRELGKCRRLGDGGEGAGATSRVPSAQGGSAEIGSPALCQERANRRDHLRALAGCSR